VTLVGTLTSTGPGPALVIEGPADRDVFETFVAQCLVPHLHPGQTVVLDNLSVHKSAPARRLIEEAGCALCFLPRYSPDFNPIEQAFAKIKTMLRRAEARTLETLVPATGAALAAITAHDAAGFFAEAGFQLAGQHL
jgi:transposase